MPARKRRLNAAARALDATQRRIELAPRGREALQNLCDGDCDRELLIRILTNIRFARRLDTRDYIFGFAPRPLRAIIRRLRKCATDLDKVNEREVGQSLILSENFQPSSALVCHPLKLARALREYGDHLDFFRGKLRGGLNRNLNLNIALLLAHIHERTGRWHDSDVATLLGAVLDKTGFDEVNQRMWRRAHKGLVKEASLALRHITATRRTAG